MLISPCLCGLSRWPGLLSSTAWPWKELSKSRCPKEQEAEAARAGKGCAWGWVSVTSTIVCCLKQAWTPQIPGDGEGTGGIGESL